MDEPVAWFCKLPDNKLSIKIVGKPTEGNWEPLYTTPQKKEWVGLTDEEVELLDCVYLNDLGYDECEIDERSVTMFSRAIEAKLKEKNT